MSSGQRALPGRSLTGQSPPGTVDLCLLHMDLAWLMPVCSAHIGGDAYQRLGSPALSSRSDTEWQAQRSTGRGPPVSHASQRQPRSHFPVPEIIRRF